MNMCASGNHDYSKKYGVCGIICAIVLFPCGLICLLYVSIYLISIMGLVNSLALFSTDVEKRCVRCGAKA